MNDESSTIDQKIEAVVQKIFRHDLSYAWKMIDKYGYDIDNIDDCDMKDYIKTLKLINESIDLDETDLHEIFEQCDFADIDKVSAERELKREFCKKYLEDLYAPKESDRQAGTTNIYEAGTSFKIIMTSVSPFSDSKRTIENYKTDWNRPVISTQHFCASYIRNDMISTPPIPHICYGFSNMKADSLMLSGTEDVYSSSRTFVSTANYNEVYYTPNEQINNTNSYNEIDFRRIQGGEKIQPDYIIIFRKDGQIDNLEEAQRASEQWDGMPIVVVDVDDCLKAERDRVEEKLAEYKKHPSQKLAEEIKQKIRNNRNTYMKFIQKDKLTPAQWRRTFAGFWSDIHKELMQIQNGLIRSNAQINSDLTEETVDEEQLEENYKSVSTTERESEVSKIREIYRKVINVTRGGKDDGR